MAPMSRAHRGMQTKLTKMSIRCSNLAQRVRQNASLSSMATRYQTRFFKFSVPLRGSNPGLQRPAILTMSMRRRIRSKVQTGRKMRNQLQVILLSNLRTSMMRKMSVKIHVRRTLWARDMFIWNAGLRAQQQADLREKKTIIIRNMSSIYTPNIQLISSCGVASFEIKLLKGTF